MLACHFLRTISQPFDHYMNPDNNQEWLNSQDTGFVMRRHPLSFEVDKGLMQRFEPKNEDDWSIGGTDAAKASMRLGYSTGRVEAFASAMEYIEEERCEETQRMFDDCAERGAIDGNTTCMFMGALSYLERGINIDRALRWLHVAAEDFLDGACAETLGDVYSHGASSVILVCPDDEQLAALILFTVQHGGDPARWQSGQLLFRTLEVVTTMSQGDGKSTMAFTPLSYHR